MPSPTQSNQIQAQAGEPTKIHPNYGPVYIRLCKDSRGKPVSKTVEIVSDMMAIDYDQHGFPIGIELLGGFCIEAAPHRDQPSSSSPSSKQEDDREWESSKCPCGCGITHMKPKPPDSNPPAKSEDKAPSGGCQCIDKTCPTCDPSPTKPAESVDECGNCGAPIQAPTGGKMDACLTCQPEHGMPAPKPTQSVQPWPEDLSVLVGRKVVLRSKKYGDRRPGVVDRIFCVEDGSCIHFAHGVGWMAGDHDLLSVSPPLSEHPLKQIIENDKRQSVQREGKVRYFVGAREAGCVVTGSPQGTVAYRIRTPGGDPVADPVTQILVDAMNAGFEIPADMLKPTQPKDSKEMGPEWLPEGIEPILQKYRVGQAPTQKDMAERDAIWRSSLKSANERAKAAEKNYHDLIMAVAQKFPNETRHETAKRYIIERENKLSEPGQSKAL